MNPRPDRRAFLGSTAIALCASALGTEVVPAKAAAADSNSATGSSGSSTFVPFQHVPGPKRLQLADADNSGSVNASPDWMADRLAILNFITAYPYLIDEGRWNEWFELFADDIVFETTVPGLGTIISEGIAPFKAIIDIRYIQPGKTSTAVRRHTMGNIHVARQTATMAEVRTYLFISVVPNADKLEILTSGTYNATLQKRNGRWLITRWYIELDAGVKPSAMPKGFGDKIRFIPDPRMTGETPAAASD
jgi:3-phenylpropionate/cinnamic acid dioxygenase small subunit